VVSGASHGMAVPLPDAQAGVASITMTPAAIIAVCDRSLRRTAARTIWRGDFIGEALS
jgi:hypothetical protein